jgi:hypothetical protein
MLLSPGHQRRNRWRYKAQNISTTGKRSRALLLCSLDENDTCAESFLFAAGSHR